MQNGVEIKNKIGQISAEIALTRMTSCEAISMEGPI